MSKAALIIFISFCSTMAFGEEPTAEAPGYKISGDFRFRHKGTQTEGQDERRIHEVRARLGIVGTVNEYTKAVFRIATGYGGISANQQLGKNTARTFENKPFNLDQGYIDWKSEGSVEVMLGKTANPFYAVGKSQLIWDSDISPEGLSLKTNFNLAEGFDVFVNAGSYWVAENYDSVGKDQGDTGVVGGQLGLKYAANGWKVILGGGQTDYVGFKEDRLVENTPPATISDTNTLNADGTYVNGYKLTELFAEVSTKFDDLEPMIFAHSVSNSEASDKKTALWAGLGLIYKNVSLTVASLKVEKDAVVSKLTDSDTPGTDITATRLMASYKVVENTTLALSYQKGTNPIESGLTKTWIMADAIVTF